LGSSPSSNNSSAHGHPDNWHEFRYNASHQGASPLYGPVVNSTLWHLSGQGVGGVASPVQGPDGSVYQANGHGFIRQIRSDGLFGWYFAIPKHPQAIISTPAINGKGDLIFGTQIGILYEVSPRFGSTVPYDIVWTAATGGAIESSPVIGPNGTIYVGSDDGSLYAVRGGDGIILWSYATGGAVRSSPAVSSGGTVYFGSNDGHLYALNPNGTLAWALNTGSRIFSSPAVGPGGIVYVGGMNGRLYAVDPNGSLAWSFATNGSINSSPAVGPGGTIYVGSMDHSLYAIDPNGTELWAFPTGGPVFSSPAVDARGTVYVGSEDHLLYAILANGSLLWSFDTSGTILSSPAIGLHGTVFIASSGLHAGLIAIGGLVTLRINEYGLPAGTHWKVTVGGIVVTSGGAYALVHLRPGPYSWVTGTVSCGVGCRYDGSTGYANVVGSTTVWVSFPQQFRVTMFVSPANTGNTTPGKHTSFWVYANATFRIRAHADPFYHFSNWTTTSSLIVITNRHASRTSATIYGPGDIIANMA
ncbi:MAG: PQQ-binding-like beta-propeller repeat protein, partial [Thermoplasmata archaeon]|nr:PQQ-binding-like beta-propeller repeat protein [Thermoplasmata archaeon]